MNGKRKLGVCVIGAGRAGMIHARNFARAIPHARLVAVADPVKEAAERAAQELELPRYYLTYQDALQDAQVDAVVVVSPTVYHREIVVAAAQAGKHILCEKPMAMTVAECDDMIQAVEANQVKLQIGFMRRFDKSFSYAKERIMHGEIGDVVLVKSLTHGPSIPQRWQYDISKSNGPLAEVNSHDIDTLRWYTESEFSDVYAIAGNYRCPEAREEFPDFYDTVILSASFENGMQGFIDGAVSVKYGYDSRVEVLGTKGILFVGRLRENEVVVCNPERGIVTPFMETWRKLFLDAYLEEDKAFIEAILEDRTPR
ncbi:oxidoreductase, partial [candidate division KSB3 bacterium]|nr:oxidoreductase [candidate division KSB3 bacterium]MBD3323139.1 oxidoreductase [candidate division KSB3 bacterium]